MGEQSIALDKRPTTQAAALQAATPQMTEEQRTLGAARDVVDRLIPAGGGPLADFVKSQTIDVRYSSGRDTTVKKDGASLVLTVSGASKTSSIIAALTSADRSASGRREPDVEVEAFANLGRIAGVINADENIPRAQRVALMNDLTLDAAAIRDDHALAVKDRPQDVIKKYLRQYPNDLQSYLKGLGRGGEEGVVIEQSVSKRSITLSEDNRGVKTVAIAFPASDLDGPARAIAETVKALVIARGGVRRGASEAEYRPGELKVMDQLIDGALKAGAPAEDLDDLRRAREMLAR